jgi:hypothetical protein
LLNTKRRANCQDMLPQRTRRARRQFK